MKHQIVVGHLPTYLSITTFIALALVSLQLGISQMPRHDSNRSPSSISLKHALAPAAPCRNFLRPVQFFSETALVVLSGSPGDCYRSVGQVALNLISIDGHVLARKPWPSTDPGVVIDAGRLVLAGPTALEVDGKDLTPIQSIELPPHRFTPVIERSDQQNAVAIAMDGVKYIFGGTPLALLKKEEASQRSASETLFSSIDGQVIVRNGESLDEQSEGHAVRKIASLEWVIPPCVRYMYCQAYGAGADIQVSTGEKRRILVYSNGSKFPITDAAGLFPYFRLQVFDFDTGAELYREEDIVRTDQRGAAISPDGDRLATTDGQTVVVRDLR